MEQLSGGARLGADHRGQIPRPLETRLEDHAEESLAPDGHNIGMTKIGESITESGSAKDLASNAAPGCRPSMAPFTARFRR